jgi:protein associated with RNAse G/E
MAPRQKISSGNLISIDARKADGMLKRKWFETLLERPSL